MILVCGINLTEQNSVVLHFNEASIMYCTTLENFVPFTDKTIATSKKKDARNDC